MGRVWMTGSVGSSLDPDEFTATVEDVLENKKAGIKGYSDPAYGIMTNNPPTNKILAPGETYKIPKGYHSGTASISVSNFEELTAATATSEDIAMDKTAFINGFKIFGTLPVVEAEDVTLSQGSSYSIPKGIHDGNGIIRTNEPTNQTPGTATSADLLLNKTAWVNGIQLMGSMNDIPAIDTISNIVINEDDIHFSISNGAHINDTASGTPEAKTTLSALFEVLNITPSIVKKDTVIGNITGTLEYVAEVPGLLYDRGNNIANFTTDTNAQLGTSTISILSYESSYVEAPFDLNGYNTLEISGFMMDTDDSVSRAISLGFTNTSGDYENIGTVYIEESVLFAEFTAIIDISHIDIKNKFRIIATNMRALISTIKLN